MNTDDERHKPQLAALVQAKWQHFTLSKLQGSWSGLTNEILQDSQHILVSFPSGVCPRNNNGVSLGGGLIGSSRSGDRKEVKGFLEHKLDPDDSALAILIKEADYAAGHEKMKQYGGEALVVELTAEDQAALDALGDDEEFVAAVNEEEEVVKSAGVSHDTP